MTVLVQPLAQHLLITSDIKSVAIDRIDSAIKDGVIVTIMLGGDAVLSLRNATNGFEIGGNIWHDKYKIQETRFYVNQASFPRSLIIKWDDLLAKGKMTASELVDIPSMANRKVIGYQQNEETRVMRFAFDIVKPEECISWDDLKIEMTR